MEPGRLSYRFCPSPRNSAEQSAGESVEKRRGVVDRREERQRLVLGWSGLNRLWRLAQVAGLINTGGG